MPTPHLCCACYCVVSIAYTNAEGEVHTAIGTLGNCIQRPIQYAQHVNEQRTVQCAHRMLSRLSCAEFSSRAGEIVHRSGGMNESGELAGARSSAGRRNRSMPRCMCKGKRGARRTNSQYSLANGIMLRVFCCHHQDYALIKYERWMIGFFLCCVCVCVLSLMARHRAHKTRPGKCIIMLQMGCVVFLPYIKLCAPPPPSLDIFSRFCLASVYIPVYMVRCRRRRCCCCCAWILAWLGWYSAVKVLSLNCIHMLPFLSIPHDFRCGCGSLRLVSSSSISLFLVFISIFLSVHTVPGTFTHTHTQKRRVLFSVVFWLTFLLYWRSNRMPKIYCTQTTAAAAVAEAHEKCSCGRRNGTQWRNSASPLNFGCWLSVVGGIENRKRNRRSLRTQLLACTGLDEFAAFGGKMLNE